MNTLNEFLLIILTAAVLQNAVFTRGLGSSKETLMMGSPKRILIFGGALTFIAVTASLLAWPLNFFLTSPKGPMSGFTQGRLLIALGCICLIYTALYLSTKYFFPVIHYYLRPYLSFASFNCAALGSILLAFSSNYTLLKTIGFAFGSGVGYTLAILLIYEGKRRIVLSDVPRSFRGLPVMLLYIGILSLAVYGLIGHQLPT